MASGPSAHTPKTWASALMASTRTSSRMVLKSREYSTRRTSSTPGERASMRSTGLLSSCRAAAAAAVLSLSVMTRLDRLTFFRFSSHRRRLCTNMTTSPQFLKHMLTQPRPRHDSTAPLKAADRQSNAHHSGTSDARLNSSLRAASTKKRVMPMNVSPPSAARRVWMSPRSSIERMLSVIARFLPRKFAEYVHCEMAYVPKCGQPRAAVLHTGHEATATSAWYDSTVCTHRCSHSTAPWRVVWSRSTRLADGVRFSL